MLNKIVSICSCVVFLLALYGCSMFGGNGGGYSDASPRASSSLILPPGLSSPSVESGQAVESKYYMLNRNRNMQIVQGKSELWLLVSGQTMNQVWPLLLDFINKQGLSIKHEDMHLGTIETNWVTRDNIVPETGIRKLFDMAGMGKMYSLQSQYKFRVTLLGNGHDTLVFVTDYQMNEVYPGCVANPGQSIKVAPSDAQSTKWMPVAPDPQLELGFLLQFMQSN